MVYIKEKHKRSFKSLKATKSVVCQLIKRLTILGCKINKKDAKSIK